MYFNRTQIDNFIEASIELDKELKEQEIVDKKRQKELEKVKAKMPPKKTNAKMKTNGKEPEKNTESIREAQKQARREEALDKHSIRLISIGQDRFHNRYWYWNALHGRLFVERPASTPDTSANGHSTNSKNSTNSHSTNATNTTTTWGYYQTKSELDALLEFLDERGIRELSLRAALTKKYPKMVAAMEKRAHEMTLPVAEVRRSSRIKTTRTEKEPPFMTYVNKFA
jgi:bromodomain adjacent to zinc finger domain protein 1A